MISVHHDLVANQIRPELVESKDNSQKLFLCSGVIQLSIIQSSACIVNHLKDFTRFCPNTAPIAKSLASHISSNGKDQSGATTIGAEINLSFNTEKACKHCESNSNGIPWTNKLDNGFAICEKSLINRL